MSAIQQYMSYATGWKDMAQSPDYWNACNTSTGVPTNVVGYQQARTGQAYAGIFKDNFTPSLQGREYIRGSLICPLVPGVEYEVTYYVSQAEDYKNCSNNFGVWFLTNVNYKPPTLSFTGKYHINSTVMICDTANWVEVKGTFTADSAYTYFIIGNPLSKDSTTFNLPPQGSFSQSQTYYYIDDVSIVSVNSLYDSIIGPDTMCYQGSVIYVAPQDSDIVSYDWIVPNGLSLVSGQGTDSAEIKADSMGIYKIMLVLNRYCNMQDTLSKTIYVDTLTYGKLGNDTTICKGNTLILDATALGNSYIWSTNDTTASIQVATAGDYWVEVFDGNCLNHYSISVDLVSYPTPVLNGPDSLCMGNQATYFISGDSATYNYNWILPSNLTLISAQNEDSIITMASVAGDNNIIQLAYQNACGLDTLSENMYISSVPVVNLGKDTLICFGTSSILQGGSENYTYIWSTGEMTDQIIVSDSGLFWAMATSLLGCGSDTDTIYISYEDCNSYFYIPNSFSPNSDGINDLFIPKGIGIEDFNMQIFNRWGQLLFTASSVNDGWDGTYNGNEVPLGVYIYKLSYSISENDFRQHKYSTGRVTLLK